MEDLNAQKSCVYYRLRLQSSSCGRGLNIGAVLGYLKRVVFEFNVVEIFDDLSNRDQQIVTVLKQQHA